LSLVNDLFSLVNDLFPDSLCAVGSQALQDEFDRLKGLQEHIGQRTKHLDIKKSALSALEKRCLEVRLLHFLLRGRVRSALPAAVGSILGTHNFFFVKRYSFFQGVPKFCTVSKRPNMWGNSCWKILIKWQIIKMLIIHE